MTAVSIESVEEIVGDFEIACESNWHKSRGFTEPAKWLAWRVQCCPDSGARVKAICDQCLEAIKQSPGVVCSFCHSVTTPGRLTLKRVEPLW